jgi:hypothetical protein
VVAAQLQQASRYGNAGEYDEKLRPNLGDPCSMPIEEEEKVLAVPKNIVLVDKVRTDSVPPNGADGRFHTLTLFSFSPMSPVA